MSELKSSVDPSLTLPHPCCAVTFDKIQPFALMPSPLDNVIAVAVALLWFAVSAARDPNDPADIDGAPGIEGP